MMPRWRVEGYGKIVGTESRESDGICILDKWIIVICVLDN